MEAERSADARVHIIVRGLVQGVYFRADTRSCAAGLGLRGVVRNLPDGSVEIVAEGPREGLNELVRYARVGPPAARVDAIEVQFGEATGGFAGFRVAF